MTTEPFPEPASPQPEDDSDLRVPQEALSRAYERARRGGYRAGSPEMEALRQAESRYQQARAGRRHGTARPVQAVAHRLRLGALWQDPQCGSGHASAGPAAATSRGHQS